MAFSLLRLALLFASTALMLVLLTPASAASLLQNGGFEQGSSGWSGIGLSTSGCSPHDGNSAIAVSSYVEQTLPSPVGSGTYKLAGWLKAKSGAASARLSLIWLDSSDSTLVTSSKDVTAGAEYAAVSFQMVAPANTYGLRVHIAALSGTLCADDFALDGPPVLPPPTATSPATATSPPSQQQSNSSTATPGASSAAKPSSTPSSTPVLQTAAPGFELVNGSFEEGLRGWSKFGGTLDAVDAPVRSGLHAGQLTSATDATKWAYQTLLVDASRYYEFDGYVGSDAGVSRAYLRISWYASSDGSGTALSTSDSTAAISGASLYTYLSTGPVLPPDGAHSARPRVVITPLGAAAASIVFDDLWFGPVEPPAEPETESGPTPDESVAAATEEPPVAPAANASDARRPDAAAPESAAPAVTAEVRSAAVAGPSDLLPSGPLELSQRHDRGVALIWLVTAPALVAVAILAYWQGKRRSV